MCGVAGFWRVDGGKEGDAEKLRQMGELIRHRGPDDYGYLFANTRTGETTVSRCSEVYFRPDLFLCSRRLAITDLSSAASQPMSNSQKDRFLVFNGAIHNYVELRNELIRLGHSFRTDSDTEVVLCAYEAWGSRCVNHFNGMWAFIIWDRRLGMVFSSRDRFGIKPLFIASYSDSHYFASEAKAIAGIEPRARKANHSYIAHSMLRLSSLDEKYTHFKGIELAPSAHNVTFTSTGKRVDRYWNYNNQSENYDFSEPAETFKELFNDAVKIRLRGDVKVSMLLSGGLDSSSIAVSTHGAGAAHVNAFSSRFEGFHDDESRFAAIAAKHANLSISFVDYNPQDLIAELSKVAWHLDAPVTKGQMLARWKLIQHASKTSTVLLEGQGADELLGGYPNRYYWDYLRSELTADGRFGERLTKAVESLKSDEQQHMVKSRLKKIVWNRFTSQKADARVSTQDVLSPELKAQNPIFEEADQIFPDPLNSRLHKDHARLLLPHLLRFGDAISMGNSMESRLPFLDHRLVEFVFALPYGKKIRGQHTKVILRESIGPSLPEEILARPKKVGFATPEPQWLRSCYESQIRPVLKSKRLRDRGLFNEAGLEKLMRDFEQDNHGFLILIRCLGIETWYRTFIDGDGFSEMQSFSDAFR